MTINYDYDINSTNYNPATTTFYWRVVSRGAGDGGIAGVVVNDFDTSSGSTLSGGNTTTIQVGVKEQTGTQGTRNFTLEVSTSATFASNVVTKDFQVTDGVAAVPTYTIQGSDPLSINETASASTITVNTTNVPDSTVLYWNITTDAPGSTEATTDWQAYNSGGTGFTINSNTGSFQIDATADAFTDGSTETFYLHVRTGSDTGTSVDSIQLNVTDDSLTPASGVNTDHLIAFPYTWFAAEANGGATNIDLEFATNGSINTSSNTFVDRYPWVSLAGNAQSKTTIDTQGWATDISGTFSSGADYQVQAVVTINAGVGTMSLDTNPADAMDGSTTWYGLNGGPTIYLDFGHTVAALRTATVELTIKEWDGTGGGLGTGTTVLEKEFGFSLGVNQP